MVAKTKPRDAPTDTPSIPSTFLVYDTDFLFLTTYPRYTRFSLIFATRRALSTTPLEGLDWGQSISSVGGRAEGARSNFSFEAHIPFF